MSDMIDRATGSTGNAVSDGLTRAGWVAAVQASVAFTVLRWDWLATDELALLEIPITFAAVAAWGMWDRFGRLPSA
jgi:membrane protease YdiL (CAAX protease family)